ncbi:hypothetical protein [Vibrio harveyi]|uniref:hypothetical protein n=1 Tax=Vibrio harveyi TaxID=669 RepID=UPI0025AF0E22|nr:hypothetical protein [Vibrio harveyi]WJT08824.1 hypothetical protein PH545_22465 [Vibrio harveyi]
MTELKIERVELYAVADRDAAPVPWADNQEPLLYTNNIVRLICNDGTEGLGATISYTENDFDRCIIESQRTIVPGLLGKNPLATQELYNWLMARCTWGGLPAKAPIDIAAWDIKGKKAGMPLYMLFRWRSKQNVVLRIDANVRHRRRVLPVPRRLHCTRL